MTAIAATEKHASSLHRVLSVIVVIFFLISLTVPTAFQLQRGAVLAAIVSISFAVYYYNSKFIVSKVVLCWYAVSMLTSAFFIVRGAFLDAPGAFAVATVYVVWPTLFIFLTGLGGGQRLFSALVRSIVWGTLLSAVMGLSMVADAYFELGLDLAELFGGLGESAVSLLGSHIEYTLPNIATLIVGIPVIMTLIAMKDHKKSPVDFLLYGISIFLAVAATAISGRRALILVVLVAPIFMISLSIASRSRLDIRLLLVSGFAAIAVLFFLFMPLLGLEIEGMVADFLTGFDTNASVSSSLRGAQFEALLQGWAERPLLGHGLGATSELIVRSESQPWAYELSYLALLFQVGVLGVLVYASGVVWVFFEGVRCMRRMPNTAPLLLPILTGLACFLVANGTNPYLAKFDYLWTLFLPIAIISYARTRKP